ncbi:hypothetical protein GCK72_015470 [Caenorhabditis remanei]|uniref:Protein kinase domain-containing protein n=1 Tax=Caenorhabditis remanei TaxID=31234 RepID=A0A6A5GU54_CAERE|nr:hypothetical protein GCK72_015470 [Caenorhabditis remanei]KAF1759010.1 hypothetical protein GCK72_015470 [Caenorhabditis remanei]
MSPEMFKGAGYTRATDIWTFGILALELITEIAGDKLDFVKRMLQFEENRISSGDVKWDTILDYSFKDDPYQLPAKENSKDPIILEDPKNW